MRSHRLVLGFLASVSCANAAYADVTLQRIEIENGSPVILVKGEFGPSDSPEILSREVAASGARVVTFDSNGGNVVSAIAYGRMIRSLGLSTFQLRSTQCASACMLAFAGGVTRQAEPGAIGVHQSSFSPDSNLDGHEAVAAVQAITAQIMTYLIEMDIDPKLLQLSLSVPSDDMRYLTASEMQAFRVTSSNSGSAADAPAKTETTPLPAPSSTPKAAAEPTTEQKALTFLSAYHDAWSRGNADALAFMEKAYAESVGFYGKPTQKAAVIDEKRKFATRWPVRAYSVKPGSARVVCGTTCRVDGVVDWYAKRDVGDRTSSGTAEFSLVWDQKTGTIISESGKVIAVDKGVSSPVRLITQWREQNGACRGGSGDSDETLAACDLREAIGSKLQAAGWCYGREGEYGYQMDWHACDVGKGKVDAPVAAATASTMSARPDPADFPTRTMFSGKTSLPDFRGRDRDFNTFRTRIRDGMREGPNFAGRYSVIQIGCGAGCSFVIVADNKTGRPANFPRGGEDNMYLDLSYGLNSRLLAAQWLDYDQSRCILEYFDFDHGEWKAVAKIDLGPTDVCYRTIRENLR